MDFEVRILPEAEGDMVEIYHYVMSHDSTGHADKLLTAFERKCWSLTTAPQRGHGVPELQGIHVEGFREIHHKPYRIIYQITGAMVFVHAVLDGRRELHELLEQRLFR